MRGHVVAFRQGRNISTRRLASCVWSRPRAYLFLLPVPHLAFWREFGFRLSVYPQARKLPGQEASRFTVDLSLAAALPPLWRQLVAWRRREEPRDRSRYNTGRAERSDCRTQRFSESRPSKQGKPRLGKPGTLPRCRSIHSRPGTVSLSGRVSGRARLFPWPKCVHAISDNSANTTGSSDASAISRPRPMPARAATDARSTSPATSWLPLAPLRRRPNPATHADLSLNRKTAPRRSAREK